MQLLKASAPISAILFGNVAEVSKVQFSKALFPMLFTLSGIETEESKETSGTSIYCRDLMLISELGNEAEERALESGVAPYSISDELNTVKALSPITVVPSLISHSVTSYCTFMR